MNKRKVEIVVEQAVGETPATVSFTVYELTGFRTYTDQGGDGGFAVDELSDELVDMLTALDTP